MSHAIGLKFTFFRNFWTRCFLPVPRLQKCPQNKFLSLLLEKKRRELVHAVLTTWMLCGKLHLIKVGGQDPSSVTSVQTEYGCLSCKHDGDSLTSVPQPSSGCLWSQELMGKVGWKPTSHGWEWGSLKGLVLAPCPQAFLPSFLPGCCPWATLSRVTTPWIWSKGSNCYLQSVAMPT